MILWDDGFFAELDDSFMVYITGRLGSGKSLGGLELSERYLKLGYKYLTQMNTVWNDDVSTMTMDEYGRRKVVIHIDEVGLYFRTAKSAGAVSSFARKQACYLIFTGRKAPHADLCDLTLQLWFDLYKYLLIPIKIWRYDRENGKKSYHGYVVQFAWWEYFGVYDTLDPGDNPDEIVEIIKRWTREFFELYKRTYKVSDVETAGGDDIADAINDLSASAGKMGDSAKEIASASGKKKFWRG